MYENMTYENILAGMLERVASPVDKREGSLVWDALAPAAFELARLYQALELVLQEGFADTASRAYLVLRAKERGLSPRPAGPATALGLIETQTEVAVGSRFCCERFNWRVTRSLGENLFELECEEAGSEPNAYLGRLVPLEYLSGLNRAELQRLIVPGEDEESTEAFRARYLRDLLEQRFGGNVADYVAKAESVAGVGAAKVQAAWAGGGTVRLLLLDEKLSVPTADLLERVQQLFDPRGLAAGQGAGLGLAPIGHVVTVAAAEARTGDVALQLPLREGWQAAAVAAAVRGCVEGYLADLRTEWAAAEHLTVRISQLEARILQLPGVLDVSGLTLAGTAANLQLSDTEIPVRGQVDVR